MATEPQQRSYSAPCPSCGAPVKFLSAQSTHAVCEYCHSTVVRNGDVLARVGKMAELFDDHSLLQLGVSGKLDGQSFTLVGRLQYQYPQGTWTEWVAMLGDGSGAWLSEDNGAYVFTHKVTAPDNLPTSDQFTVGQALHVGGKSFKVASKETVSLLAAEGELPHLPALGTPFVVVELRNDAGEVLSLDYGPVVAGDKVALTLGRAVDLDQLQLSGLRQDTEKSEQGQSFACPNCGAAVQVTLAKTQSITCGTCHSVIDLSQGVGGELQHAQQQQVFAPLIALGTVGTLQGIVWQVVGFQRRQGQDYGPAAEVFAWDEYLLYNQTKGFAFLVDSAEGWSMVRPATGAPEYATGARAARYLGHDYFAKEAYQAQTLYVAGEFYWRVEAGQGTHNVDFVAGRDRLSLEQTAHEINWSIGSALDSATVAQAFHMQDSLALMQRSDATPMASLDINFWRNVLMFLVVMAIVVILVTQCTSQPQYDPNGSTSSSNSHVYFGSGYSPRSSGGSWGGQSGGGGHK